MAQAKYGRIGVFMGGPSSEREVSLRSGRAVFEALAGLGLDVVAVDIKTDRPQETIEAVRSHGIDCVFLALHGYFGEDGGIQQVLDGIRVPYTASSAEAARLAMDKVASVHIFAQAGLEVPRGKVLSKDTPADSLRAECLQLGLPLVIKPAGQGSSIGLSIVDDEASLEAAFAKAFGFDRRVIAEEYIEGRELTVGILEEEPLPVIEIVPKRRFFDYDAKYKAGLTEYLLPAPLPPDLGALVQKSALTAHRSLGCSGMSRVDIILNKRNVPYVLELNAIPGFTSTSLLPKAARLAGIEFPALCERLIGLAYARQAAHGIYERT